MQKTISNRCFMNITRLRIVYFKCLIWSVTIGLVFQILVRVKQKFYHSLNKIHLFYFDPRFLLDGLPLQERRNADEHRNQAYDQGEIADGCRGRRGRCPVLLVL